MVVGFDFHQDMRIVFGVAISAVSRRKEAPHVRAFDDRRIVGVSNDGAARMPFVRIANHGEQRLGLRLAVYHPVGVENLVAAMLGIRLREHHELDVGGITLQPLEVLPQVFDFVVGKRQAHFAVGGLQSRHAASHDIDGTKRLRLVMLKQLPCFIEGAQHGLRHAVMNQRQQQRDFACRQPAAVSLAGVVRGATLDALDCRQSALPRDIGGFG